MKEGDYVYATDPETGESGAREVIATLPHTDQLLTLRTSSGEIVTTEDHKYWNETDREWQESQDLDPGDQLLTADGDQVTVEGLDWTTLHTAAAYDLTIDDLHTFYVAAGDDEVLVHNCLATKSNYRDLFKKAHPGALKSTDQVHHALPQKYEAIMNRVGVNIHENQFLRGVDSQVHKRITKEWADWDRALGRSPTSQEITNFSYYIDEKYGAYFVFG